MSDLQLLTAVRKYETWQRHLEENQITLNRIDPLYIHRADKGDSVLYALLKVDARSPEGNALNPLCFLKGDAVSILVVLIDQETDEKYVVLVSQRRICDGSCTYEHPAGMIDEADTSPLEVAVRELGEEIQLTVEPAEIKPLFTRPLYSATSTSDEAIHFFYLERRMAFADINALNGRSTGEEGENEHTTLHIATLPEAHQLVSNIHSVMSHLLYLKQIGDYERMRLL